MRNRFSSAVNGDRQTAIPRRSYLFCFVLTRGEDSLLTSVYHCQTTRRAHASKGLMGIEVSHVMRVVYRVRKYTTRENRDPEKRLSTQNVM